MTAEPVVGDTRRRVFRQLLRNPQGAVCLAFLALEPSSSLLVAMSRWRQDQATGGAAA